MSRLSQLSRFRVGSPLRSGSLGELASGCTKALEELAADCARLVGYLIEEFRDLRVWAEQRPKVTPWQSGTINASLGDFIQADCAIGDVMVLLPEAKAADAGRKIWLIRRNASNVVTARPPSTVSVHGAAAGVAFTFSVSLLVRFLVWTGAEWRIV